MSQIKKIAIVWESQTGGGVNSYLKYLLQSRVFLDKQITIFTNSENKGAKFLIKDFAQQKNIKFIFFNSFFVFNRKRSLLEKLLYYFFKPVFFIATIFRFKKILSNSEFDALLCTCGTYGNFMSEIAAIFAAKNTQITVKSIVVHHACIKPPIFMGIVFKIIDTNETANIAINSRMSRGVKLKKYKKNVCFSIPLTWFTNKLVK